MCLLTRERNEFLKLCKIQGDTSRRYEPLIDLDLGCSVIMPGQLVATVAAYQLPGLSELRQREVFANVKGHPVEVM